MTEHAVSGRRPVAGPRGLRTGSSATVPLGMADRPPPVPLTGPVPRGRAPDPGWLSDPGATTGARSPSGARDPVGPRKSKFGPEKIKPEDADE